MSVRVFVVAEIRLFRDLLSESLARCSEVEVVGTAATGESALRQLRERTADVVMLDARTPDAIASVRMLLNADRGFRVLALSVPELEPQVMRLVEAGVAGYVREDATIGELVQATQSIARGETLCSPRIAAALVRRVAALAAERETHDPATRLTSREREVVSLIEQGLSNKEIARRLSIELSTAKNHVHNILEKLGAKRRAEAVARISRIESRTALLARTRGD